MQSTPDISPLLTQLSYSATAVWAIQKAKGCPRLPWITANSDGINRALNVILSGIAAIGMHWTVTGSLQAGSTITITVPSLSEVLYGFFHWFQSYVLQETVYHAIKSRNGNEKQTKEPQMYNRYGDRITPPTAEQPRES